jgi:hypothetical protein
MVLLADNAIADLPAFNICADFNDAPRVFVTEHDGRPILMCVFFNMNISAADSAGGDFDENPPWLYFRLWPITL